jgi:hypothetical protein
LHVGGEQLIQCFGGQLCRRAEPGKPGVVDQDVDVADLLGQPQRLCGFAQVGGTNRAEPPLFSISATT